MLYTPRCCEPHVGVSSSAPEPSSCAASAARRASSDRRICKGISLREVALRLRPGGFVSLFSVIQLLREGTLTYPVFAYPCLYPANKLSIVSRYSMDQPKTGPLAIWDNRFSHVRRLAFGIRALDKHILSYQPVTCIIFFPFTRRVPKY